MKTNNFTTIGKGKYRILFCLHQQYITPELDTELKKMNIELSCLDKNYIVSIQSKIPTGMTINGARIFPKNLNSIKDKWYKDFFDNILNFVIKNKIKYIITTYNIFCDAHLKKFRELGIRTATIFTDDPEDTYTISKVYAPKYDKIICSGVQFNEHKTIEEVIRSFGIKDVKFLPLPPFPSHYDKEKIDYNKKDIDIVYIGAIQWRKWHRLYLLHKNFPNKFVLYSAYDPRNKKDVYGLMYRLLNRVWPLPKVTNLPDSEVKQIYKRAKIGFNCHQKWGPANTRTYELCLNGVLQITDNPKGNSRLFNVGKEILCYNNMDEAIQFIRYYLKNDSKRIQISKAGYVKAWKEYTSEKNVTNYMRYVLK